MEWTSQGNIFCFTVQVPMIKERCNCVVKLLGLRRMGTIGLSKNWSFPRWGSKKTILYLSTRRALEVVRRENLSWRRHEYTYRCLKAFIGFLAISHTGSKTQTTINH